MGRLIDSSSINNCVMMHKSDWGIFATVIDNIISGIVMKCPTVEAIPKAEVKKFLEEGTKDVSNKVLAIVREDYIHKSVYEARLKADMVAMLTEIQLEIEKKSWGKRLDGSDPAVDMVDVNIIIQQKINALKAESEET